ncbi:CLUMA_CG012187, isoform A [Clunio marinus]|uniref:CLUMA_CG012187, isoform A n=1 Tax=Clunio marinus TaxID=568069 RepID=A0A1J1IH83_9DIPT|nr:CLUMA_CG012187, isoform A [Clunio marinus]
MKFVVIFVLILCVILQTINGAPCERESVPWLETVNIAEGCVSGEEIQYQCKECKCDENGKTASCPKWIKCCNIGDVWSTNACNICVCNESYQRICEATKCSFHRKP